MYIYIYDEVRGGRIRDLYCNWARCDLTSKVENLILKGVKLLRKGYQFQEEVDRLDCNITYMKEICAYINSN
jgi:hypothetical protein